MSRAGSVTESENRDTLSPFGNLCRHTAGLGSRMKQVIIENPVLNSPFEVPQRHFKFDDEGITNEIVESRRSSAYFIPIAKPKMQGKQLRLDAGWTEERIRPCGGNLIMSSLLWENG